MTITNLSVFRSTDGGAVSGVNGRCSGTAGDGVALLNQLLLNGYNWQTSNNVTQSGNVATFTLIAHGFNSDQRLWILGADQSGYNSDAVYPLSVGTNSFTYAVTGSPSSPATTNGSTTLSAAIVSTSATTVSLSSAGGLPSSGVYPIKIDSEWMLVTGGQGTTTLTVVRGFGNSTAATHLVSAAVVNLILVGVAPAGGYSHWTADFTTTNKSTYRPPAGNRMWLDVDDTGTNTMQVRGYETMSATATGTGAFPTTAQVATGATYVSKSSAISTAARAWICVATDRGFFLWTDSAGAGNNPTLCGYLVFTDLINSLKTGDAYATVLMYDVSSAGGGNNSVLSTTSNGAVQSSCYMPRSYTQLGTAIQFGKTPADGRAGSSAVSGGGPMTYPHPPDGGLYITQIFISEGATVSRGTLPFYWHLMHTKLATHTDTVPGTGAYAGKKFEFVNIYNGAQCLFEISNTIPNA